MKNNQLTRLPAGRATATNRYIIHLQPQISYTDRMGLLRRVFMIAAVAAVTYYAYTNYGSHFLASKNPAVKKSADNVLGAATGILGQGASASANLVSGLVLKTATQPLIKEYDKLNSSQKDIIKKQICK